MSMPTLRQSPAIASRSLRVPSGWDFPPRRAGGVCAGHWLGKTENEEKAAANDRMPNRMILLFIIAPLFKKRI